MILFPLQQLTYRGCEVMNFIKDRPGNEYTFQQLLFQDCNQLKIVVDYNVTKYSIIEQILKCGQFHLKLDKKDTKMSYDIKNDYILLYLGAKQKITICSYEIKFSQAFENFQKAKELEMFDEDKCPTCTLDSKHFVRTQCLTEKNVADYVGANIWRKRFPQPEGDELQVWKSAKDNIKQFQYVRKADEYKDVYSYDIKSSFSSRIYNGVIPCGNAKVYDGDITDEKKYHIYVLRLYSAKPKKYDYLDIESKFKKNYDEAFTYTATEDVRNILDGFYDCKYNVISTYQYGLRKNYLDYFLDGCLNNKLNTRQHIKRYNKAKCNLLFGSFGAIDSVIKREYRMQDDMLVTDMHEEVVKQKSYYPIYLYIQGKALLYFINILHDRFEHILYANTDGFFSDCDFDFDYYNLRWYNNIGRVELRGQYKKFAVKGLSNYCTLDYDGNVDFRLSGTKPYGEMTYEKFINGFDTYNFFVTKYGFVAMQRLYEPSLNDFIKSFEVEQLLDRLEKLHVFTVQKREHGKLVRLTKENATKDNIEFLISTFGTRDDVTILQDKRIQRKLEKYGLELVVDEEELKALNEVF